MSNSSEQFEDQAKVLRKRMHLTNEDGVTEELLYNNGGESGEEDLNVLNLPPRSETHKDKKTGYKWKVRYPLIRFLIVLFIILILLIPIYNIWGKQGETGNGSLSSVNSAKASDASYMLELTRHKKAPQSDFAFQEEEENDTHVNTETEDQGTKTENKNKDNTISSSKDGVTPSFKEYVVKEGDTLFSITMKFYNRKDGKQRIIKANQIESEEIYVGQTLLIPQ